MLDTAGSESANVAGAARAYDAARWGALRPGADELIAEAVAELRFNLHNGEPSAQRRIMRTYGAR